MSKSGLLALTGYMGDELDRLQQSTAPASARGAIKARRVEILTPKKSFGALSPGVLAPWRFNSGSALSTLARRLRAPARAYCDGNTARCEVRRWIASAHSRSAEVGARSKGDDQSAVPKTSRRRAMSGSST